MCLLCKYFPNIFQHRWDYLATNEDIVAGAWRTGATRRYDSTCNVSFWPIKVAQVIKEGGNHVWSWPKAYTRKKKIWLGNDHYHYSRAPPSTSWPARTVIYASNDKGSRAVRQDSYVCCVSYVRLLDAICSFLYIDTYVYLQEMLLTCTHARTYTHPHMNEYLYDRPPQAPHHQRAMQGTLYYWNINTINPRIKPVWTNDSTPREIKPNFLSSHLYTIHITTA